MYKSQFIMAVMRNAEQAATKQDLAELEQRMTASMAELEQRMTASMQLAIRDMETRLLNAFYEFAQTLQKNLEQMHRADFSLSERVSRVENRVLEIEKRMNIPPGA